MFRDPSIEIQQFFTTGLTTHISGSNYWKNDICITNTSIKCLTPIFTPVYRGLVDE